MPELPEIAARAAEMQAALTGRTIAGVEVLQPKCLNVPVERFTAALAGARLRGTTHRGKWLLTDTTQGWLLLNMGMGGELLLVERSRLPEKRRLAFEFAGGDCLSVNFWWFGYAHYLPPGPVEQHEMVGRLGPNALEVDAARLKEMLAGQRGAVKAFLLDQSRLAGIGNAYVHDILFLARLHPLRKISTLSPAEVDGLARAIQQGLRPSLEKGGAFYEVDLFGRKGRFTAEEILVGYREGEPCPACGTPILKIKTGSTSSFICPGCQPL